MNSTLRFTIADVHINQSSKMGQFVEHRKQIDGLWYVGMTATGPPLIGDLWQGKRYCSICFHEDAMVASKAAFEVLQLKIIGSKESPRGTEVECIDASVVRPAAEVFAKK